MKRYKSKVREITISSTVGVVPETPMHEPILTPEEKKKKLKKSKKIKTVIKK